MTSLDERLLEKQIQGIPKKDPVPRFGLTGYNIKGTVRAYVPRDPSRVYVRFPDGGFVKALHNGKVSDEEDIAVNVYEDEKKGWIVEGINNFEAGGYIYIGGTGITMPPHNHISSEIVDLGDNAVLHSALPVGKVLYRVGGTTYDGFKFNITTTDPDITDDDSEGYAALSFWLNTVSGKIFDCLDASEGAAVWVERGAGGGSGGGGISTGGGETKKFAPDGSEIITQVVLQPQVILIPLEGTLITESIGLRVYNRYGVARTITNVFCAVNAAPDGADIIVDILKDGTTIFAAPGDRPTISDGSNTGETTAIDDNVWGVSEYLQIEVAQIGSTDPGSDLTVHISVN